MRKIEYKEGDIVGNGFVFVREVEPHVQPSGRKRRRAIFICPKCKQEVEMDIQRAKVAKFCKLCSPSQKKEYQKGDIIGNGYIYLKDVEPHRGPKGLPERMALVICPKCKSKIEMRVATLTKLTGCKNCTLSIKRDLRGQKFGKLTVIKDSGKRIRRKVIWECLCDCGNKILVNTSNLKSGSTTSCGCIGSSKGEDIIKNILEKNTIHFCKEKIFKTCKNPKTNGQLRFDFYLPDYNCCIEFDGRQHFEQPSGKWGGKLEDIQYRDEIKNQWCKDHNVNLIRIPYTDIDKLSEEYLMGLLERTKIEFITGSTSECGTSEGTKGEEEEATEVHL